MQRVGRALLNSKLWAQYHPDYLHSETSCLYFILEVYKQNDKGKLVVRRGRKATGSMRYRIASCQSKEDVFRPIL